MDSFEPKKLALIRILQILERHSDRSHPLTQEQIASHLEDDYGIVIERKAVGRNISLLREAGFDIAGGRDGSYLDSREFENSELRMLIDAVLSSRYINVGHSKDLIEKLCGLSNKYFRSHVKNIHSVTEWSKTDNKALFYNIGIVDTAIESGKQVSFDYNKYGADKKLHFTKRHTASPYQLILHNQRYYLMALNEKWKDITYYRLDRITNMRTEELPLTPIRSLRGYEDGIDYSELATSLPYMFTDKQERVTFCADIGIVDQIVDWFGDNARIYTEGGDRITVTVTSSPKAMEYWAMQYLNYVEVLSPQALRDKIKENLKNATEKYGADR